VFSASSQSFTLLVRALKAQGRVDILSRPQVQVMDNQAGFIQVGADFPYLSTSTLTGVGTAQQSIEYRQIGVTMRVTPRINPDGKVLMRVEPTVSSVSPTPINLGNGVNAPAFNIQTVQTTVLASDGETIVLGGMISKQDQRTENGLPFFKDIPYVGALFRYRTHQIQRREVLVIMTPHIMRSEADQARILAEEAARINWCTPDIARIHGHGMEVIGPATQGARAVPLNGPMSGAPGGYPGGYYAPGPAYFGSIAPEGSNPAAVATQPGMLPPHAQPYYPGATGQPMNPQPMHPGAVPAPAAPPVPPVGLPAAPVVPTQPQPQPGIAPPGTGPGISAQPGVPTITPAAMIPGQPGAATPVVPAAATQPGAGMPVAPPMPMGPMAPTAPAGAPPVGPKFGMVMPNGQFVPPAGTPPVAAAPAWPDTANRGFVMQPSPRQQPAGNGTPADRTDRRNTEAREGQSWTFDRR
jgi:general secretion pathway protein D